MDTSRTHHNQSTNKTCSKKTRSRPDATAECLNCKKSIPSTCSLACCKRYACIKCIITGDTRNIMKCPFCRVVLVPEQLIAWAPHCEMCNDILDDLKHCQLCRLDMCRTCWRDKHGHHGMLLHAPEPPLVKQLDDYTQLLITLQNIKQHFDQIMISKLKLEALKKDGMHIIEEAFDAAHFALDKQEEEIKTQFMKETSRQTQILERDCATTCTKSERVTRALAERKYNTGITQVDPWGPLTISTEIVKHDVTYALPLVVTLKCTLNNTQSQIAK